MQENVMYVSIVIDSEKTYMRLSKHVPYTQMESLAVRDVPLDDKRTDAYEFTLSFNLIVVFNVRSKKRKTICRILEKFSEINRASLIDN